MHVNPTYEVIKMKFLIRSYVAKHFHVLTRTVARDIAHQMLKNAEIREKLFSLQSVSGASETHITNNQNDALDKFF